MWYDNYNDDDCDDDKEEELPNYFRVQWAAQGLDAALVAKVLPACLKEHGLSIECIQAWNATIVPVLNKWA